MAITGFNIGSDGFGIQSGSSGPSLSKQYRKLRDYTPQIIKAQVSALRANGVHPAFAMGGGAGGNVGMATPVGGSEGGFAGSYSKKVISGPEAAAIRESNARKRLLEAQTTEQNLINATMRSSIANKHKQNQGQTEKPVAESQFKGMKLPGGKTMPTGDSAGAQEWEDRYWEFGGAAGALMNIGGDAVGALPKETWDRWIDRQMRNRDMKRRRDAKIKQKKYQPGYKFAPYKSQRGNWK